MLVLSRKPGERILIGEDIVVTVVRFQGGTVRLGIEAPREHAVIREELSASFAEQDSENGSFKVEQHDPSQRPANGKASTSCNSSSNHRR